MSGPLRFAVLELEHWYNALPFIASLQGSEKVVLTGISHREPERGAVIAREAGVPFFADYRELLARPDVDAVGIFAASDRVAEITIAAADAGKPIVAIKPMARTAAEADRVVAGVEAAHVLYLPSDAHYRLAAVIAQVKTWMQAGRIGNVCAVQATGHAPIPRAWRDSTERGWWTRPQRTVGGAWIDHAIYQLDYVRHLLGTQYTSVRAFVANVRTADLGGLEDYGIGTFSTETGVPVTIEDSWTASSGGLRQALRITGSQGAIEVDFATQAVRVAGRFDELGTRRLAMPLNTERVPLADHLADCLREGTPCAADVHDARSNLAACLAFYESAATGRPVAVRTMV